MLQKKDKFLFLLICKILFLNNLFYSIPFFIDAAAQEIINFLVILPFDWNSTRCSDIGCDVAHIYACVYLQGSSVAFPRSR